MKKLIKYILASMMFACFTLETVHAEDVQVKDGIGFNSANDITPRLLGGIWYYTAMGGFTGTVRLVLKSTVYYNNLVPESVSKASVSDFYDGVLDYTKTSSFVVNLEAI